MRNDQPQAPNRVERAILFFAGCIMASIGIAMLYFVYRIAHDGRVWDYEYLYIAGCTGFAFLLLRGAFYTVIPENVVESISISRKR